MIRKDFEKLGETLVTTHLATGLTVNVVPKQGFTRCLAYFATNFGANKGALTLFHHLANLCAVTL